MKEFQFILNRITLFMLFIIWGEYHFYAINPTEVLVNISKFNVFFINEHGNFNASINNKSDFSLILTIILSVEMYFIFYRAFK